ncbi:MAG: hypothetical protein Q8L90_04695 [Bacteroidota bacterium]|nr:hypothetical protein [Bacteroidota bacterium]
MENKHKELLEKWNKTRPEYNQENGFTSDGPSNWHEWTEQKPRILFLLKEALDTFTPSNPTQHQIGAKSFGLNIARWKYAIKKLYENPHETLSFPSKEFIKEWSNNTNADIAIVEVKKFDENNGVSNPKKISSYAMRDKEFLKEQIRLINPQIILCCKTGDDYANYLYIEDYDIKEPLISDSNCNCYKDVNRLIIDFYHPSTRNEARAKELFEILCKMIKEGNIFKKFDWGNIK